MGLSEPPGVLFGTFRNSLGTSKWCSTGFDLLTPVSMYLPRFRRQVSQLYLIGCFCLQVAGGSTKRAAKSSRDVLGQGGRHSVGQALRGPQWTPRGPETRPAIFVNETHVLRIFQFTPLLSSLDRSPRGSETRPAGFAKTRGSIICLLYAPPRDVCGARWGHRFKLSWATEATCAPRAGRTILGAC